MVWLTKKVAIIIGAVVVVAVIGITLGIVLSGGNEDDNNDTTVQTTQQPTDSTNGPTDSTNGPTDSTNEPTNPPDGTLRVIKIPASFKIGTATAAYQIEGGWDADGKGPSIWDTFTHDHPERIADGSTGDVAANSYEKYQEDVDALVSIGAQFYRFSIAWSRVLPTGDIQSRNEDGIQYYHKLIDALRSKGIEPMATMYHWDLPQYIQDLGGWMNPLIVDYFEDYADLLFQEYGSKVKSWITFNEPLEYCGNGYGSGSWPPALQLPGVGEYYCSHHTVLAHARAYHLYRDKYYAAQQGQVGITLSTGYAFPQDEGNTEHQEASDRSMQWSIGIYAHPIFTTRGDYPQVMRERIDKNSLDQGFAWSRLPEFTAEEVEYIKGTSDFLGLNYYTSRIVQPVQDGTTFQEPSKWHDTYISSKQDSSWPRAKSSWLASIPEGLYRTLLWIRDNYQNVETIITENGWSDDGQIEDVDRIKYLELHFEAIADAIEDGCKVTGHTSWSLIDNFEWLLGYTEKFGIFRVNVLDPNLKRVEKNSAGWLRDVIQNREYTILPEDPSREVTIPAGFKIGTATAAYQIEGGWDADGKGPSIWDTFTHDHPERIADGSTGDVAANSYAKYQEDVDALVSIGAQFYRFSIAWSRVLPTGDIQSRNEDGIQYYHKLIDALRSKGIEPMATMYHWDLPQYIQDLGGWMNPLIVDYFEDYADLLFQEYGSKVKSWITFNEPLEYCGNGYGSGSWPPALQLPGVGEYYCSHHTVLAHARAYHLYRDKYYAAQQGQVGITLSTGYAFPQDEGNTEHQEASDRSMQWSIGIYAHPIFTTTGDYPQVMRERIAKNSLDQGFAWSRLPEFTAEEVEYIKGTSDFLGLNYYTSSIVQPVQDGTTFQEPSKWHDTYISSKQNSTWPRAKSSWLASIPEGLYRTLLWIRDNYQNVETVITENGWSDHGEIDDVDRIKYLELHFEAVIDAIDDGCKVTGHTSWSLVDNFEWLRGYTEKFGIFRVDVDTSELTRVEKKSAGWLRDVIVNRRYTIK